MVTKEHESPIDLLEFDTSLLVALLRAHKWDVPENAAVRLCSERFTELGPFELKSDAVYLIEVAGKAKLVVIYEVQRSRDRAKRRTWPRYVSGAWGRYGIPVCLLVYCPNPSIGRWAARPIVMGDGCYTTATVVSSHTMPLITDATWRGNIRLAVTAAFVHADGPHRQDVLHTLGDLLATIDPKQAQRYIEILGATLSGPANQVLEAIVTSGTHTYQDAWTRFGQYAEERGHKTGEKRGLERGLERGQFTGEIKALLTVLESRGIAVPDGERATITACRDHDQLENWLQRAGKIDDISQLFQ